ncbi:hypothetical protein Q3H58_002533 [Pseudomonas psychrotolerans]|uniref:Uncharacterized protein n=1 Tax=Pseudomonas oryzihabitans TaxID=47885 RepID=A0AAJ2BY71_9PSED|nr:hypothetical protein [Pseudomonas psychrotolerans]MDR6355862.1 hypothetical protein [Pseudomonas psychrotolerans]
MRVAVHQRSSLLGFAALSANLRRAASVRVIPRTERLDEGIAQDIEEGL